ncbi:hypothetical protein [Engelhardtia mirabilis]|uniref:Uncharacterized protein n=1 Tax=Engelhardtia mirabilis TaxID=2528011 RepID=A0A518BL43_9BACT|nr:hypothetical protein Pla133_27760 [Planctomycetes bacterium Pla133]QDV02014.1 hypothetical protein Pla86_27750 [Planctomycetes bacterium Pla86]
MVDRLATNMAKYVGMIEAAEVIYRRFGPFGPIARHLGAARAYRAIMKEARELAKLNERARREARTDD